MIRVIIHGCCGRMGNVLANLISSTTDMQVVAGIDIMEASCAFPVYRNLESCKVEADVLIDFSSPSSLKNFLPVVVDRHIPVVVATTGLGPEELDMLRQASAAIAVFRSASMSVGVNLMEKLLQNASKVLGDRYDVEIIEKHHKLKKDAPSGTALMLADAINGVRQNPLRYVYGRQGSDSLRKSDELGIHSIRGGTFIGEHEVIFAGMDEVITIGHRAYSRQIYANGAIAAARYSVRQKPGLYSMHDMINEYSAVTTITTVPNVILVSLENVPKDMGLISGLYQGLASKDIIIDMISHTGSTNGHLSISFTIKAMDEGKTQEVLESLVADHSGIRYGIINRVSKIVVEGPGMEIQSGVASRLFSSMAKVAIQILAVTTSDREISYLTSDSDVSKAIGVIKAEFKI